MPNYNSKEEEIVAYDYYTNLKHSSYKNIVIAARLLGIKTKEISRSLGDNSYAVEGLYFKVEPRKSFKPARRYV